ncbi:TPM domain-containing protein [Candidatus Woesearchaeota archaeon]|nr:TPM domain-containing protein [Candidatus Woesearchaeota archaeon]
MNGKKTSKEKLYFWLIILCVLIVGSIESVLVIAESPSQTLIKQYVNDYGNILTPEQEQNITVILEKLQTQDKAEIAIVTINTLDSNDIKDYAFKLANNVLGYKEKNNGLLLLIVVKDKKYRFEVGRGLEPYLPDLQMKIIGDDYLVPQFKQGNYYQGIYDSVVAINNKLMPEDQQIALESTARQNNSNIHPGILLAIVIIFFILLITRFVASYTQAKSPSIVQKKGRSQNNLFEAALLAAVLTRGGRGGLGGGGFGGFGGGSFGGGGAGGSW